MLLDVVPLDTAALLDAVGSEPDLSEAKPASGALDSEPPPETAIAFQPLADSPDRSCSATSPEPTTNACIAALLFALLPARAAKETSPQVSVASLHSSSVDSLLFATGQSGQSSVMVICHWGSRRSTQAVGPSLASGAPITWRWSCCSK